MTSSRPGVDPELEAGLALFQASSPALSADDIPAFRASSTAVFALDAAELAALGVATGEYHAPGFEGAEVAITSYARADHTGTGPGIFHIHGGGMITGDRHAGVAAMLPWVVSYDAVLVTVEYRLAPEWPDPVPVEDCYAGLLWTASHAAELGIDPDRLMIAGASAGGGLAAGTALLARDRGGPGLIGQLLICPMLDDRDQSTSTQQYEDGSWTRDMNRIGWRALLGERCGGEQVSIYAAPARAADLSGLPPAYLDCGSAEVFRDEVVAYASRLWRDGSQAELHVWAGGFHGFDQLAPQARVSQAASQARTTWVARTLRPS